MFNFPIYIIIGGGTVATFCVGSLVVYFIKNPEKFEKLLSLLYKALRYICKTAEYKYVKYSVQSTLNNFVANVKKDVPNLNVENVKLEWIDEGTTAEQFFKQNQLVIRMQKSRNDNRNVVRATVAFVSYALLHKAKRYIAEYQKKAIDLFATTKILENGHSEFLSDFVDLYLADAMENKKVNDLFAKFEDIHKVRLFFPVLINELDFLGEKVFSKAKNNELVYSEVMGLINFLYQYSHRKKSEETPNDYTGAYSRFAIRIVGMKGKIQNIGESIYIRNILDISSKVETIYLVGDLSNSSFINGVVENVVNQVPYHIYNRKKYECTIKDHDGTDIKVDSYLVVLRNNKIATFQR